MRYYASILYMFLCKNLKLVIKMFATRLATEKESFFSSLTPRYSFPMSFASSIPVSSFPLCLSSFFPRFGSNNLWYIKEKLIWPLLAPTICDTEYTSCYMKPDKLHYWIFVTCSFVWNAINGVVLHWPSTNNSKKILLRRLCFWNDLKYDLELM